MGKAVVSVEEFKKLDLRVGTIKTVERVEGADRLYRMQVDLGDLGVKKTVAGIAKYYPLEELIEKKIVFLANLEPATIRGERSEGMLLAALKNNVLSLLTVDKEIPDGAEVS